jgi:hypothetical protein
MAQSIKLPDGSFFPLKAGEDPREAMAEAPRKIPRVLKPQQPQALSV